MNHDKEIVEYFKTMPQSEQDLLSDEELKAVQEASDRLASQTNYIQDYSSNPSNWNSPSDPDEAQMLANGEQMKKMGLNVPQDYVDAFRSTAGGATLGLPYKIAGALGDKELEAAYKKSVERFPGLNAAGFMASPNPLAKLGTAGRILGSAGQVGLNEYNKNDNLEDATSAGLGAGLLQAGAEAIFPPVVSALSEKAAPAIRTLSNSVLGNFLGMSESQIAALRATGELDDFLSGLAGEKVLQGGMSREDALTKAYNAPVDDILNQPNAIQGQKFLEQVTKTPSVSTSGGATERLLRSSVAQRAQSAAGMGSRKLAEYMSSKLPQTQTPSTAVFSRILDSILSSNHPEVETDIYTQQNPEFARWYMEQQKELDNGQN